MGFAKDCNQVILALGLDGSVGTTSQTKHGRYDTTGDSWKSGEDIKIYRTGKQLLPRYVVHFDRSQLGSPPIRGMHKPKIKCSHKMARGSTSFFQDNFKKPKN
jgi:hypothetical protein